MKGNKGKVLALGVIVMFCAVAIIGAGYAAFAGTASTYNAGNTTETENIVLSGTAGGQGQTEWSAFTVDETKLPMYTHRYNRSSTNYIAYWLDESGATTAGTHEKAYLIGQKTFKVENNTSNAISKINLTLTAGSDLGTKFVFTAVVGSQSHDFVSGTAQVSDISISAAAGGEATFTVQLYASAGAYDVKVPDNRAGPAEQAVSPENNNAWEVEEGTTFTVLDDVSFGVLITDATPVTP